MLGLKIVQKGLKRSMRNSKVHGKSKRSMKYLSKAHERFKKVHGWLRKTFLEGFKKVHGKYEGSMGRRKSPWIFFPKGSIVEVVHGVHDSSKDSL